MKMTGKKQIYISRIQNRMFFLAFVTAFVAAFTQTLAVFVDNAVVCAFYGETEIAAVSLAGPFFYLLEIPAAGLAAGIQTVFAREIGAGQIDRVNRQFSMVFFFSAAVMAGVTLLAFLTVPQMAVLFGARGNTAALQPYAADYLYGLSFEILPYVLFCITVPAVVLDNGSRLVSIASVCGCAADIVLDLCSVWFGWGLFGIGAASAASALIYFLIVMLHFLKKDRIIRLKFERIRFEELREVFASSAPKAFQSLADAVKSVFYISLVSAAGGVMGTFVLSVHGTITYFVMIIASAVAGAAGTMTGICCGEKNGEELDGIGVLVGRYNFILSAAVISALLVIVRPLSVWLAGNAESVQLLRFAVYCIMAALPFSVLVQARISSLQAVGHVKEARRMAVANNFAALALLAGILTPLFGVRGVFLSFPCAPLSVLMISWLLHWKKTGRITPSESDYLEVGDSFYAMPGDVISYPVRTKEECMLASEQVILFCRGHKMTERTGYLAGLCMEEVTINLFEHGMSQSSVIWSADIRVVIDGEHVIIRLRDNGRAFNLKMLTDRLMEEEINPESKTDLRILMGAAKDVAYYRTYGMNTTIIRV